MESPEIGGRTRNLEATSTTTSKLRDKLVNLFSKADKPSDKPSREVREYLEADLTDPTDRNKTKREKSGSKLKKLKSIIQRGGAGGQGKVETPDIRAVINGSVRELSQNASGADKQFFSQINRGIAVKEDNLLPMAKYINKVAEGSTQGSQEGVRKINAAVEIFLGEDVPSVENLETVAQIARYARDYYGLPDDFSVELHRRLVEDYGIDDFAAIDLLQSIEAEPFETERTEAGSEPLDVLRKKFVETLSKGDQIKADMLLTTLDPLQILKLVQTFTKTDKEAARHQFMEEMIRKSKLTFDNPEASRQALMEYYTLLGMRIHEVYESQLGGGRFQLMFRQQNQVVRNFDSFDEKQLKNITELASYLMVGTSDPYTMVEFFRGKVAQLSRQEAGYYEESGIDLTKLETKISGALNSRNQELRVADDQFDEIFHDIRTLALRGLGGSDQGTNRWMGFYHDVSSSVQSMKADPYVKKQLKFGQTTDESKEHEELAVAFMYEDTRQDSHNGEERIRTTEVKRQESIAYIAPLYISSEIGAIEQGYRALKEITEKAKGGNSEAFSEAAKQLNNATAEKLFARREVMQAYATYLSIIERKLVANNYALTPDLFKELNSEKLEIDYQLEQELKFLYPDMNDQEKSVYSAIGRGLTIASGDLLWLLSKATPPMDVALGKIKAQEGTPAAIVIGKMERGERIRQSEFEHIKGALIEQFGPSYNDFPFRELLFELNPLKWMWFWIKHDPYNLNLLSFAPIDLEERMPPVSERWNRAVDVWNATVFGINTDDEKTAKAFREQEIPAFMLEKLGAHASLSRRAGWRNESFFYTREDCIFIPGSSVVDGEATFTKILKRDGQTAAYNFLKKPPGNIRIKWETEDSKKRDKEMVGSIVSDFFQNRPTFFFRHEQPQYFRHNESFRGSIEAWIRDNYRNNGLVAFLTHDEVEALRGTEANPLTFGENDDLTRARRIFERAMSGLEFVERARIDIFKAGDVTVEDFILNPDDERFKTLKERTKAYLVGNIKKVYDAQGTEEELYREFIKISRKIFYDKDSLMAKSRVKGIFSEETSLKDYYSKLILNGNVDPFGWENMNNMNLHFQHIGMTLFPRNAGDLGAYIGVTKHFGDIINGAVEAIQTRDTEKSVEKMIAKLKEAIPKIKTFKQSYGDDGAAKAAGTMFAYVGGIFRGSLARDIPLAGRYVPGQASWASFNYPSDKYGSLNWSVKEMKKVYDAVEPEGMFIYGQSDLKTTGLSSKIQIPMGKGKDGTARKLEVPLPSFLVEPLQKAFPTLFRIKSKPHIGDWTVENIRGHLRIDEGYVFGNMMATILIIGFLLMLWKAMQEGMKEVEMK